MKRLLSCTFCIVTFALMFLNFSTQQFVKAQAADPEEWQTYVHDAWGLLFRYPLGWSITAPDFERLATPTDDLAPPHTYDPNMDAVRTWGHIVAIDPSEDNFKDLARIEIVLQSYTLSTGVSLEEWVNIDNKFDSMFGSGVTRAGQANRKITPIPAEERPQNVDDAILESTEAVTSIWLSRESLVYGIYVYNATDLGIEIAKTVVASFEFDPEIHSSLLTAPFNGNETLMRSLIDDSSAENPDTGNDSRSQSERVSIADVRPTMAQKALSARWTSPLLLSGSNEFNVGCGAAGHP